MKLFPRYMINLGIFSGLKAFVEVELLQRKMFFFRSYPFPFFLRPGTTDRNVFREVLLFNEYDFNLAHEPAVIVDAGANIGLSSVFFTLKFPKTMVYAIEPDNLNFKMLQKNTRPYPNIRPIHSALWYSDVYLKIKDRNENAWAFQVEESSSQEPGSFPALCMATLMRTNSIERIDLLKLDVEGSEKEIFFSNYEYWLPRTKTIIIELHDWMREGCSRAFFTAISKYRFKLQVHSGMLLLTNLALD